MSEPIGTQVEDRAASLWRQYRSLHNRHRRTRAELMRIRTQLTALLFEQRERLEYPHNFHFWLRWLGIPKSTAYRWMKLTPPPTRWPTPKPPEPPSEYELPSDTLCIHFNPRQAEIFRRAVSTIERNGGLINFAYSCEAMIDDQLNRLLQAPRAEPDLPSDLPSETRRTQGESHSP
jgi:hypothetical protein